MSLDEIYFLRQECRELIGEIWDLSKKGGRMRSKLWVKRHINKSLENADKVRVLLLRKYLQEKRDGEHCSLHTVDNASTRRKERIGYKWDSLRKDFLASIPNKCNHCGKPDLVGKDASVDHIKPLALGGKSELSNLQLLCASCHNKKTRGKEGWDIIRKHLKSNKPFIEQKVAEYREVLAKEGKL